MKNGYKFIILLGIVSLFADMTYEGARSVTGAYLAVLGANALTVGFVAGFGEFLGFGLRYISGILTDQTHKYWPIMIVGYAINLFAVPLLAIAGNWQIAAFLIVLERVGKSIRIPARDAMLAHASESVGMGRGFGFHEMMDRVGAFLGPIIVSASLLINHSYELGFAILGIPAVFAIVSLFVARHRYPNPQELAVNTFSVNAPIPKKKFILFLVGSGLLAFGFSDYALIAYHFEKAQLLLPVLIPIAYGVSMGVNGITAPMIGHWYDKKGIMILVPLIIFSTLFAPLVYLGGAISAFMGVFLWAIGMGVQSSLLRSIVGQMSTAGKRGRAFGLFNLVYGVFWFIGSVLSGYLYDFNVTVLVYFIVATQLLAVPFFMGMKHGK
ncbi:MAG: MFS transporter [Gammaproteobacteria bacterium]|nr:MFS transporter [Gammaproteobacteria bacterium]